ncbi:MAG TPA: N-acetylglucosamine/diacetylchitobiose ABC transporter substrate-binding protein [Thermomicrobiales bacterium]|nr:N-acetylglucosamine/diacetylchitobiose ABC transporter substrate-binding protein [Thermomicrobiales bacterium]
MTDRGIERLLAQAGGSQTRRDLIKRGAALGLSAPAIAAAMTALSGKGAYAQGTPTAAGAGNPLGVDPNAPLDVVIFKGGYGDDYAINVNQNLYAKLYPNAQITYAGIIRLGEQLQPRFVAGNPPDVIDNSGAGNLDNAALVAEGQLADLADLMAAPSYDTEGKTFAETLVPGSQDSGVFDGKQLLLNWALTVVGVWYSDTFMKSKGYTYPKTWDEMLALCEEIKGSGVAPWATTGVYPQYIELFVMDQMIYKHDPQAAINIDNLEADAWRAPAVKEVVEALYMLGDKGYILPGWEGLTHTESQAEWLQGKAVFLPCGTWLENEMKDLIPADFNMVVAPTPSLPGDKVPFEGIIASSGEPFIVPSKGKNVQGGKEWLRLLFSVEGGKFFAENTKSLSVVQGSGEGLDLGSAFASTQTAIQAAGANTFPTARYGDWYSDMEEEIKNALGSLLQKQISIDEFIDTAQDAADTIKDDDSIVKYHRDK